MLPATTPQKADPTPATTTPLSVTKKVMSAASRWDSSRKAAARPLPMVPNSASPAIATTSSLGNAVSSPVTVSYTHLTLPTKA